MRFVPYFILTGELSDRARSTLQINNREQPIKIGEIKTVEPKEITYKGGGSIVFGVYEDGRRIGVCLGREYGAGKRGEISYIVIHPTSEDGDTDVVTQYAKKENLGLATVTTLKELEAVL